MPGPPIDVSNLKQAAAIDRHFVRMASEKHSLRFKSLYQGFRGRAVELMSTIYNLYAEANALTVNIRVFMRLDYSYLEVIVDEKRMSPLPH